MGDFLPCPFCGSSHIKHWDAVYVETFCNNCGAAVRPEEKSYDDSAYEAGRLRWNTRASSPVEAMIAAGAKFEVHTPPLPESEMIRYLQQEILRLRKELMRYEQRAKALAQEKGNG